MRPEVSRSDAPAADPDPSGDVPVSAEKKRGSALAARRVSWPRRGADSAIGDCSTAETRGFPGDSQTGVPTVCGGEAGAMAEARMEEDADETSVQLQKWGRYFQLNLENGAAMSWQPSTHTDSY